jgi:hypothetical protein
VRLEKSVVIVELIKYFNELLTRVSSALFLLHGIPPCIIDKTNYTLHYFLIYFGESNISSVPL